VNEEKALGSVRNRVTSNLEEIKDICHSTLFTGHIIMAKVLNLRFSYSRNSTGITLNLNQTLNFMLRNCSIEGGDLMPDKIETRRQNAIKNAQLAYKLIDKKENYQRLLAAVETNVNEANFYTLCKDLGMDDEAGKKLWKLIRVECANEGNICW
jgi:hypothetical protein